MRFKKGTILAIRVTLYVSVAAFTVLFSIGLIKSKYENFAIAILQQESPHAGSYSLISPWAWLYRSDNESAYLQDIVNTHLGTYQGHELLSWTIDHDKLLEGGLPMEFLFRVKHSNGESVERFSIAGYFDPKVTFQHVHVTD